MGKTHLHAKPLATFLLMALGIATLLAAISLIAPLLILHDFVKHLLF